MSTKIQIARGNLSKVETPLPQGSLFWQSANENNQSSDRPWDEGTLYIYGPHVLENNSTEATPLAIGGTRLRTAFVYKGTLSTEESIDDTKFKYVRTGDIFVWSTDAINGYFHETDDFRRGDLLFITSAIANVESGLSENISYTRINCSGGFADDTYYDRIDSSLEATNVSAAIKELELEKLSYRGVIPNQQALAELTLEIGTLYLCTGDGIVFPTNQTTFSAKRGDFVYYRNSTLLWKQIPSGFTDDTDIDFTSAEAVSSTMYPTFEDTHVSNVSALTNVGDVLNFLLKEKAQLDSSGKVPLSQMNDTLLGTSRYKGVWSPVIADTDETDLNNPLYQNPLPGYTPNDTVYDRVSTAVPKAGDYWVVKIDGFEIGSNRKVTYADKTSLQPDGTYAKYFTISNGDWIIYQYDIVGGETSVNGSWEVIDRTEDLSYLNYEINGVYKEDAEATYSQTTSTYSVTGTPLFKAIGKLVYINDGGSIVVSGVRLVNEDINENGKTYFLPKYSSTETNSLKNSSIEDNGDTVTIHSNTAIGKLGENENLSVYGDINVGSKSEYHADTNSYTFSKTNVNFVDKVNGQVASEEKETYTESVSYIKSTISLATTGITLSEETDSSDLGTFGELTTAVNDNSALANALDLLEVDDSTTLTFENQQILAGDVVVLKYETVTENEITTNTMSCGDNILENYTGTYNVMSMHDVEKTRTVTLYTDTIIDTKESLTTQETYEDNAVVLLPSKSGTLFLLEDNAQLINGTEKIIPIFGVPTTIDGTIQSTLTDSEIKQSTGILYSQITNETNDFLGLTETDEDLEIGYNIFVGKLDQGNITPKALHVTKFFALGTTHKMFLQTGNSLYPEAAQHFDTQGNAKELTDVYVEAPSEGGVLLTGNSIIDGGLYE